MNSLLSFEVHPKRRSPIALVLTLILFTFALAAAALLTGCPKTTARPKQGVRIRCKHADARVFVDGHFLGRGRRVFDKIISLPPGRHLIEVRMDGHYVRYREVVVERGNVHRLKLSLHRAIDWKRRKPKTLE
jgi:hypothetical protein